jgi:nitroimidazol reductase NimA-like FMN-containing flavoprotein (pyridoxamine 5'-phosphate oxidase superfamily)
MRRIDRWINDEDRIVDIVKRCTVVNVAFIDKGIPYVIPMNFGFTKAEDKFILYFHSAKEGKKNDIIKEKPIVAFNMFTNTTLIIDNIPCKSTMKFESVCGDGVAEFLEENEKYLAFELIMKQYSPEKNYIISKAMVNAVSMWKITVNNWNGKTNIQAE